MIQALLIYSLFNTISLPLESDLAGADFAATFIILDFNPSFYQKKKKPRKKPHTQWERDSSLWLLLTDFLSLKVLVSTAAPPGFNKQWSRGFVCMCVVCVHAWLFVCVQFWTVSR